jgi:glyoxylase-like metal-dependent hydrolase (beta-lactamase superfamily II)
MINKIKENVFEFKFKEFGSKVYLIKFNKENILIDTSSKENKNELISSLTEIGLKPEDINKLIITHPHYDHMQNISLFNNAKIFDSENFKKFPFEEFKFYLTPGHTQEDIIILFQDILFSGDVIFHNGYVGRTDFPESSPEKMKQSLDFISKLDYKILCPGH